jgi:hypothetical protein
MIGRDIQMEWRLVSSHRGSDVGAVRGWFEGIVHRSYAHMTTIPTTMPSSPETMHCSHLYTIVVLTVHPLPSASIGCNWLQVVHRSQAMQAIAGIGYQPVALTSACINLSMNRRSDCDSGRAAELPDADGDDGGNNRTNEDREAATWSRCCRLDMLRTTATFSSSITTLSIEATHNRHHRERERERVENVRVMAIGLDDAR